MRVTFTKQAGRRYLVAIDREHGPPLQPRHGPGYDELLPHDLAHYVVEEQLGIRLGVFGQLAAGGAGLFAPAPADRRGGDRRADKRFAVAGRDDMRRSEAAVGRCVAEWLRRTGRASGPVADVDIELTEADVERVVRRLAEVAEEWTELVPGRSLSFTWPRTATVDPAGSHQGRRRDRNATRTRTRPR
ncbi:MAG TPA: hypothetical protein VNA11_05205 [Pseudonocardia sp.]|nr:hypothetical protein [Pseudonocardia sp.]